MKILVADKLAEEGLDFLTQSGANFDVKVGLSDEGLAATVGDYDAMVVPSAPKKAGISRALQNREKLKAIARAGVGVDNIALEPPPAKGVLVMNTAEASTLSTA